MKSPPKPPRSGGSDIAGYEEALSDDNGGGDGGGGGGSSSTGTHLSPDDAGKKKEGRGKSPFRYKPPLVLIKKIINYLATLGLEWGFDRRKIVVFLGTILGFFILKIPVARVGLCIEKPPMIFNCCASNFIHFETEAKLTLIYKENYSRLKTIIY
jgi:hypothetical protein